MITADRLLAYEPSDVKPGWVALLIVLALAVATFLLWRNMNKQMRKIKVPYSAEFRQQDSETTAARPAPPGQAPPEPDVDDRESPPTP